MVERNVKINDDLQERIDGVIEEVESLIEDFLKENEDWDGDNYELYNKLEYNGSISEFIDSATPIYYADIDGLWFLYKHEFTEAYIDAGIGDNPTENGGMTAIYLYIQEQVIDWFHSVLDIDDYREKEEEE